MTPTARTEKAISKWLESSSEVPEIARSDWERGRPAILRTGVRYDAVRMPSSLVHAAVESVEPEAVARALADRLSGPVIADPVAWYYALVPRGTCETWNSPLAVVRGHGSWLGIPPADHTDPSAPGVYWAVPVTETGDLCDAEAVAELLAAGARIDGTTTP
ncbi:hypothetical protein [Streptomyces sp. NPDC059479]|uniref:hypothetical protein n=1 Tax=Streptomyces sp. NPDC059479 TaxID=3346848 RepID=UPI0036CDD6DF